MLFSLVKRSLLSATQTVSSRSIIGASYSQVANYIQGNRISNMNSAIFSHKNLITSSRELNLVQGSLVKNSSYELPNVEKNIGNDYSLPSITYLNNSLIDIALPTSGVMEKLDPLPVHQIEAPSSEALIIRKYAARLIQIRKKKMKKHKLKKLRKRMRFRWGKDRQKREWKKEVLFQKKLMDQIELAEQFDAEAWVKDILSRVKNKPIPETDEERKIRLKALKEKNKGKIWM